MIFYRLLVTLAVPFFVAWALLRWVTGKESAQIFRARLGFDPNQAPEGHVTLWLHAASNGELASAESLIRLWHARDPDLNILVTTNSATGQALANKWGLARLTACIAPFDTAWAAARIIRRWRVQGLVVLESEFWPNRLRQTARRGLPVIFLGARLSRKSSKWWKKLHKLARLVLRDVTLLVPQDHGTPRRLRRLGLDPARIGPVIDLKALYSSEGRPKPDADLKAAFIREDTWLAASTHEGEDEIILDAYVAARRTLPDLRLILAPRHPRRAAQIRTLIEARGLSVAQRSLGEEPMGTDVYLADTMGEMAVFYDLSATCFVAGSLVDRGGHTPFEPLAHRCAILHGPYVSNFQGIYRRLDLGRGALQVSDATELATALGDAFTGGRARQLVDTARDIATREGDADSLANQVLRLMGRVPGNH